MNNTINKSRIILHIDMNCFYCSCEIAENEELANKPIVVAHKDILDRGIILSPSYEARKYGIYATMKVSDAKKLCHDLIVIEPNMDLYNSYSNSFYQYLVSISDKIIVQMASCDEAFIDISNYVFGSEAIDLAKKIQEDIYELYGLPCSIGIAPNKYLAKMASDMKKPMGITVLRKREVQEKMWPLPIKDLFGIGKKTAPKLQSIGVNTIGDFIKEENKNNIIREFGINFYQGYYQKCFGIDDSLVSSDYTLSSSVSGSNTFMEDVANTTILLNTIKVICNTICYKLQKDNQLALNVGIQIRYSNYETRNHSKPLLTPTNDEYVFYKAAKSLFDDVFDETKTVRLIGAFTNRLKEKIDEPKQISIFDNFDEIEKEQKINALVKQINNLTGGNNLKKGINNNKI